MSWRNIFVQSNTNYYTRKFKIYIDSKEKPVLLLLDNQLSICFQSTSASSGELCQELAKSESKRFVRINNNIIQAKYFW